MEEVYELALVSTGSPGVGSDPVQASELGIYRDVLWGSQTRRKV